MIDTERLEEQKKELQILESIYLDDLEMATAMSPFKFTISIQPHLEQEQQEHYNRELDLKMHFEMGRNYPVEPPKVRVIPVSHNYQPEYFQSEQKVTTVYHQKDKYIQQCFIYQIVEVMREWIYEQAINQIIRPKLKEDEKVELQVEQKQRTAFTPVTFETFTAWKKIFDIEQQEILKKQMMKQGVTQINLITGKQWFMRNKDQPSMEVYQMDSEDDSEDIE